LGFVRVVFVCDGEGDKRVIVTARGRIVCESLGRNNHHIRITPFHQHGPVHTMSAEDFDDELLVSKLKSDAAVSAKRYEMVGLEAYMPKR
jgi:hypothetical protein